MAAAMSRAPGRCDAEPAPYLTARPIARPAASVISREITVVPSAAMCTIEYTPTVTHRAFRQDGRPTRLIMVR